VRIFGSITKLQLEVRLWTTAGSVLFELRVEEKGCISVKTVKLEGNCTSLSLPVTKPKELNVVELSLFLINASRIQVFMAPCV